MQRLVSQVAKLAGLTHDLGKGTVLFQKKLNINNTNPNWPVQDPIRHEWISVELLHLFDDYVNGQTLPILKEQWKSIERLFEREKKPVTNLRTALKCVVATHHTLLSSDSRRWPTAEVFLKGWEKHQKGTDFQQNSFDYLALVHKLADTPNLDELDLKYELTPCTARAIILLSRFYLIMADHLVSSRCICESVEVYANTLKGHRGNQSLTYHLQNVGDMAYQLAQNLPSLSLPGLSADSRNKIAQPAPVDSRFKWQNETANLLSSLNKQIPTLILNIASTGSGKTRMNARALLSLCADEEHFRFTTLLGLRNLTLQTGEAFKRELSMTDSDLSTVIGDKAFNQKESGLTRDEVQIDVNSDKNSDDITFEAFSHHDHPVPPLLLEYCVQNPDSVPLLIPPCLVSTVDYLIAAGDPQRMRLHVQALLRVIHSDLIIDEIDDYDPKAFVALCRLVEMATMLGRNVVCASATLPAVMASKLVESYRSGLAMHNALQSSTAHQQVVIISDYIEPVVDNGEDCDFGGIYAEYMKRAEQRWLKESHITKSVKVTPKITDRESLATCLKASITELHRNHGWQSECQQKTVSIGLIRVANIKHIPHIASIVHRLIPTALVATYHSQDLFIQRLLKEKILDKFLTRKTNSDIICHPYLNQLIVKHPSEHLQLVLIASPVAEVGRDHDFDWAIIEPSSVRSIVQTGGRVNRHRRKQVSAPNIIILERNLKCILEGGCESNAHYCFPGFESKEHHFPSHSITELLPQSQLDVFSAFLRFTDNPMTASEDKHISDVIENPISLLTLQKRNQHAWLTSDFYFDYPLREKDIKRIFELSEEYTLMEWLLNEKGAWSSQAFPSVEFIPQLERSWLTWDFDTLVAQCEKVGISREMGMSVLLPSKNNPELKLTYNPSLAFQIV